MVGEADQATAAQAAKACDEGKKGTQFQCLGYAIPTFSFRLHPVRHAKLLVLLTFLIDEG
jgi:hypothetical protein